MSKPWPYKVMIEAQERGEPFFQTGYGRADHIGAAIATAEQDALRNECAHPVVRCFTPLDEDDVPDDVDLDSSVVAWIPERHFFPLDDRALVLPRGVVLSFDEGDVDDADIAAGYTIARYPDEGMTEIEINVERDELPSVLTAVLSLWPVFKGAWCCLNHADDQDRPNEAYFRCDALNTSESVMRFLLANEQDVLHNGLLDFAACPEGEPATVALTDHKQIVITLESEVAVERVINELDRIGYPQHDELASVSNGVYHYHYRPEGSRTHDTLRAHLVGQGFVEWDPTCA